MDPPTLILLRLRKNVLIFKIELQVDIVGDT